METSPDTTESSGRGCSDRFHTEAREGRHEKKSSALPAGKRGRPAPAARVPCLVSRVSSAVEAHEVVVRRGVEQLGGQLRRLTAVVRDVDHLAEQVARLASGEGLAGGLVVLLDHVI